MKTTYFSDGLLSCYEYASKVCQHFCWKIQDVLKESSYRSQQLHSERSPLQCKGLVAHESGGKDCLRVHVTLSSGGKARRSFASSRQSAARPGPGKPPARGRQEFCQVFSH